MQFGFSLVPTADLKVREQLTQNRYVGVVVNPIAKREHLVDLVCLQDHEPRHVPSRSNSSGP